MIALLCDWNEPQDSVKTPGLPQEPPEDEPGCLRTHEVVGTGVTGVSWFKKAEKMTRGR